MATRQWSFLSNPFAASTRNSFIKAEILFTDCHAKLQNENSDADIAIMFADLDPAYKAYQKMYAHWLSAKGSYKGKTAGLEELMSDNLPTELRKWEGAIRNQFTEDSPTEIAIFPNKRSPFFHGTYETRIIAVKSLAKKLLDYPSLTTTQIAVESFANLLETTRLVQQQNEGGVKQLSDLLEAQRIIVCKVLYGILGRLMNKYQEHPQTIAHFFDFSLFRRKKSAKKEKKQTIP